MTIMNEVMCEENQQKVGMVLLLFVTQEMISQSFFGRVVTLGSIYILAMSHDFTSIVIQDWALVEFSTLLDTWAEHRGLTVTVKVTMGVS